MWPVLLNWNGILIYSYPLFIGLSWGLGFRLAEARLPKDIPHKKFIYWMIGLFITSWIGAKLLFLLTQNQWSTEELVNSQSFWLGGGFVFLGGMILSGLYTWLVGFFQSDLKITKMNFTLVPLLYAHALGRVGCFLAGCCYGVESNLPWAIKMHGLHRHPTQIYEAIGLVALASILQKKSVQEVSLIQYFLGYGALRWVIENYRGDELRGLWMGQSSSQWVSLGFILIAIILIIRKKTNTKA
ncbi:MAG: prolipoprotein diacylglyceryl transferase [Bacteriovoracaceae bacterium]|nr:prolipoprotein diacylglyceryl transferase [Bacteriovoracaceae bacterium]